LEELPRRQLNHYDDESWAAIVEFHNRVPLAHDIA